MSGSTAGIIYPLASPSAARRTGATSTAIKRGGGWPVAAEFQEPASPSV